MKAEITLECKNPEIVAAAVKPEMETDVGKKEKFSVEINAMEEKIILNIRAQTFSGLSAGINGCLRLMRAASEVSELE